MAKESGALTVIIDDSGGSARTISTTAILSVDMATPRGVQDVTSVGQSAMDRLLLLADYSATFTGAFNDGSNDAHVVFKTVPSSSVARTTSVAHSGQTLAVEAFFTDYSISRGQDGSLTTSAPCVLTGGSVPTWA